MCYDIMVTNLSINAHFMTNVHTIINVRTEGANFEYLFEKSLLNSL